MKKQIMVVVVAGPVFPVQAGDVVEVVSTRRVVRGTENYSCPLWEGSTTIVLGNGKEIDLSDSSESPRTREFSTSEGMQYNWETSSQLVLEDGTVLKEGLAAPVAQVLVVPGEEKYRCVRCERMFGSTNASSLSHCSKECEERDEEDFHG